MLDEQRPRGPGPAVRWPLHHSGRFVCRLADLVRTERLRDAYEVGFCGRKPMKPAVAAHVSGGVGSVQRHSISGPYRVEDVPLLARLRRPAGVGCDSCGESLALPGTRDSLGTASWFYFCARCKKHGQRFELCAACRSAEVLQAESKHFGEVHPHFLHCRPDDLAKYKCIEDAYADRKHIRRAYCDSCGHLAACLADGAPLFLCRRCPDRHGVRFELCMACARDSGTLLARAEDHSTESSGLDALGQLLASAAFR